MDPNTLNNIGLVASVLAILSHVFYIKAIINKETKPSRVTWIVWAFLGIIIAVTYYKSGATTTLWVPIVEAFSYIVIALMSLKYGVGGWTRIDKFAILGVIISTIIWKVTGSPMLGLIAALGVDFMAVIPTIYKTYLDPSTEDKIAWLLTAGGSSLNLIAINDLHYSVIVYPLYMFTMNSLITLLIFRKIN